MVIQDIYKLNKLKRKEMLKQPKTFLGNVKVVWTNGQNVPVTPREGEPQQAI